MTDNVADAPLTATTPTDNSYALKDFLKATVQDSDRNNHFELENPYTLEINLPDNGRVKAKRGSMVAYTGDFKFKRESMLAGGLRKAFMKAATGEGQSIMDITGRGRVYLADKGKRVQILRLAGESIVVNGNDLLALEDGMDYDITMMKRIAGMLTGGLFNIRVKGYGLMALTTYYAPLTLRVRPDAPVLTDPNATVAWSGSLNPKLKTDMNWGTFIGRTSGETIQLEFTGKGWVVVQPYEEVYFQAS
jgi:uncharacterized protein (AIM24 family)